MSSTTEARRAVASKAEASAMPPVPPAIASTALSVSDWRTRRLRLAPRAARVANSRRRDASRASSSPATLAQAISRNRPAAPASAVSGIRTAPVTLSVSGTRSVAIPRFDSG
jgi:hypothetical protein